MTNTEIQQRGRLISSETATGGNTAARVGGVIEAIGQNLETNATAISNEASAREHGDSTLNGLISAETTARQAADETLQDNIDDEINARRTAISNEESAREHGDSTLSGMITAEASARQSADETLQDNIDAEASARRSAISNEESAREHGDSTLSGMITAEANTRQSADATLQDNIDAEESARQTAISNEAAARQSADTALGNALNNEQTARQSADAALQDDIEAEASARQTAVSDEATARQNADTALGNAINDETAARQSADTALQQSIEDNADDIGNAFVNIGYFVCDTAGATAAKTISAPNYVLQTGGNIRIKMTNANTVDNATLNINGVGAKALFYNGEQASSSNSWEAGEVLTIYYDGTQYQAAVANGGVEIDDFPTQNSENAVASGALYEIIETGMESVSEDTLALKVGGYASNGTTITENTNACYVLKYDIRGYDSIHVLLPGNATMSRLYLLDINDNELFSASAVGESTLSLDDYPTAAYLTASSSKASLSLSYVKLIKSEKSLPAAINENSESIDDIDTTINVVSYSEISYDTAQCFDGFINGGSETSYSGWKTTPLIAVEAGITIYVTGVTRDGDAYAVVSGYDANESYVGIMLTGGTYENQAIVIPKNIAYVRLTSNSSYPHAFTKIKTGKFASIQAQIDEIKEDVYTDYRELTYDVDSITNVFIRDSGAEQAYGGYIATPHISVTGGTTIYITTTSGMGDNLSAFHQLLGYDSNGNVVQTACVASGSPYTREPVVLGDTVVTIRMQAKQSYPHAYVKGVGSVMTKLKIAKKVNWVGHSIWWYSGQLYGYQDLIKDRFTFSSDNGTEYSYSGYSLGAQSESDASSIALQELPNFTGDADTIWTLDSITNDFKRNIPLGTSDDYDNATGVLTFYGALRAFADKVHTLSGDNAIVVVSNALRRNNSGYTSTSTNSVGCTLLDYEKAMLYVALQNNWYFVDQYRMSGVNDDNLDYTTMDGLHLNNFGFKLAVLPWLMAFEQIYYKLL